MTATGSSMRTLEWPPRDETLTILEHVSNPCVALDEEWRITFANARAENLAGIIPQPLTGISDELQAALRKAADGRVHIHFAGNCSPFPAEALDICPRLTGLVLVLHESSRASQLCELEARCEEQGRELRAVEERSRLAESAVNGIVYDWDLRTDGVHRSDGLVKLLGYHPGEVEGIRDWWTRQIHPDDVAAMKASWPRILTGTAGQLESEYRVRHRDGRWINVWDRATVIRNSSGRAVRIVGATSDITDRKRAEEALRVSEERYRFLAEVVPQFVWTAEGESHRFEYVNRHWTDYTGLSLAEAQDEKWLSLIHPEDLPFLLEEMKASLTNYCDYEAEYRIRRASDGMYRWYLARGRLFVMPDGVTRWLGTAVDIHDRKLAEHALRTSEEWQRIAVDAAAVGLWDWDIAEDQVIWSDTVYSIHGLRPGDFGGTLREFGELVHPDDRDFVTEQLAKALRGDGNYQAEFRILRGGQIRWLSTQGKVEFTADGNPARLRGAVTDATQRKEFEQALQYANDELRRANVDLEQFAYAAAHDLQEPLRMVSLYTQLLARRYEEQLDRTAQTYIKQARTSAERMQNLVHDLLEYTRVMHAEPVQPTPVALAGVLGEVLDNLRGGMLEAGAAVTAGLLPEVCASRVRLVQLFQNLIANAIKYRRPDIAPEISVTAEWLTGTWRFSVQDNGIGIDPQYHERIFGVFRRLHGGDIEGTGIGLAICRRIVEHYGGHIHVESQGENSGSTFVFTLPGLSPPSMSRPGHHNG